MKQTRFAILSIALLTILMNTAIVPLLGEINQAFPEAGTTLIKLTLSLPALTNIIFSLLAGRIAQYIPKKYILITGLILYSVNGIGSGFAKSIEMLLISRALLGAGAGMVSPLVNDLIANFYEGEERIQMIGYSNASSNLSGIFIPLLAGWLAGFNWRYAFLVYALGIFVLVISFLFVPVTPVDKNNRIEKKNQLSHSQTVWKIALNNFLIMVLFYTLPTNLSLFVQEEGIGNSSLAALAISISTLASTLAGLIFSKSYNKFRDNLFLISLLFSTGGFILVGFIPGVVPLFVSEILVGIGLGLIFPYFSLCMIQATNGYETTSALSLLNSSFGMGIFVSPIFYFVLGKIAGNNSIRAEFIIAALSFCLWSVMTVFTKKKVHAV